MTITHTARIDGFHPDRGPARQINPFTVIIPAYNEANVIERCLNTLLYGTPGPTVMQVIVAANGCSDKTAEIARQAAPTATVIELGKGSKTAAMNAANAVAKHFPRIYLDADIQCEYTSLEALAEALCRPGALAASPALRYDLSSSSALTRAYYRVWLTQPYVTRNMVGSGCFGLSKAGYDAIGDFPPITGDDIWVYSRFSEEERRSVSSNQNGEPVYFTVTPPRRIVDQIRVETRRRLGNEEVLERYPSQHHTHSNTVADLRTALKNGASLVDVGIYLGVKMLTRLRAKAIQRRTATIHWERDLGSREV